MHRQYESVSAAPIIYSFCLIQDDVPPLDYRSSYLAGALAPCPLFKISKILRPLACLVLARLGSFSKHEMEGGGRERVAKRRGSGTEKWKDVMWIFCFRKKSVAALGSCRLSWDARAQWSQEGESVEVMPLIYHRTGLIANVLQ